MSTCGSSSILFGPGGRKRILPLLVFGLLFAPDAFAYLDPGSGSIVLQGLIAATAAVVTWASLSWRSTKAWVLGRFGSGDRRDEHH